MIFQILSWLAFAVSLIGSYLNIKKIHWCFVLWFLANIFWVVSDIMASLYAQAALNFVFAVVSVWGFFHWKKTKST